MIGVDTNVVLRLFVVDDEAQHRRSVAFFAGRSADDPAYVNLLVIAELVWLLQRRYGFAMDRIIEVLQVLVESVNVVVERRDLLEAVIAAGPGNHKVSLADRLIAQMNQGAGCRATVTFDRPAADHIPAMELLA